MMCAVVVQLRLQSLYVDLGTIGTGHARSTVVFLGKYYFVCEPRSKGSNNKNRVNQTNFVSGMQYQGGLLLSH